MSPAFWLPLSGLAVLAFWGDLKDLSPKLRLGLQLALLTLLIAGSGHWPADTVWRLPWLLFWVVFIAGTANFYNFMDGINGISGITGVIAFGLLAGYIFYNYGPGPLSSIAICMSLSCLGFLPQNLPGAKVFMGDIGSILLGSVFGSLVFLTSQTVLDFVCMASFLFTFYADELTTMFERLRDGENLTQAHRRHVYQLLANEKGAPHWKISAGYGLLQLGVGIGALAVKPLGIMAVLLLLTLCFLIFALVSRYLRSFLERPG
jgi:Fuc2NAc and GlcNAc transferase